MTRVFLLALAIMFWPLAALAQSEQASKITGFTVLDGLDERASKIIGFALLQGSIQQTSKVVGFVVLSGTASAAGPTGTGFGLGLGITR